MSRRHDGRGPRRIPIEERLRKYARHDPATGCLIWMGGRSNGYAVTGFYGRTVRVARYLLQLAGRLRPGEMALHRCHNRACVNLDHLYSGSNQQNVWDMIGAGHAWWQRRQAALTQS